VAILIVHAQLATTKLVGNATIVGRSWDCGMSGNRRVVYAGSAGSAVSSGNTLGLELLLKSLDLAAQGIVLVNQLLEQSRVVTAFELHIFQSILELFGDIDTSHLMILGSSHVLETVVFRCKSFDSKALIALIAIQQAHNKIVDFFKFMEAHTLESINESV